MFDDLQLLVSFLGLNCHRYQVSSSVSFQTQRQNLALKLIFHKCKTSHDTRNHEMNEKSARNQEILTTQLLSCHCLCFMRIAQDAEKVNRELRGMPLDTPPPPRARKAHTLAACLLSTASIKSTELHGLSLKPGISRH